MLERIQTSSSPGGTHKFYPQVAKAFAQKVFKIQESTRHHEISKVVRTEKAAKLNVYIRSKVG